MISNQILQNTIEGLKGIARVELCVMDVDGKEVAATMDMGNCSKPAVEFAASPADSQEIQGYQYFKIYDEQQLEYILVAGGTGEDVYMIGKMVAFQIQNLLVAYKERFDKDNFIKNLLLDNLLLVDIYSRSKKLHIQTDVPRVVMIVESAGGKDNNVLELARTHFGSNSKDFITAVDESNVIVVKEFAETDTGKEIEKSARALEAALLKEGIREIRIAYGTIVHEIKEVSRSYKEAKMALDVGKIFFDERDIIAYSELGIGRLIYQLPIPLCKMFIREIFGGKSPDDFDEEMGTCILQQGKNIKIAVLVSLNPEEYVNILLYREETRIGKEGRQADVCIDRDVISRVHAKVLRREEEYFLMDLDSTNGTYINGKRLGGDGMEKLQQGDRISFADLEYIFQLQ